MKTARSVSIFTYALFWHGKHAWIHVFLGVLWFFLLTKLTEYSFLTSHFWLAILGSLAPDIEHLIYLSTKKRHSDYTNQIKILLQKRQISQVIRLVEKSHKHETYLPFHHLLTPFLFLFICFNAYQLDKVGTFVFMGAGVTHYLFDMFEDYVLLGKLNPNWTRGL